MPDATLGCAAQRKTPRHHLGKNHRYMTTNIHKKKTDTDEDRNHMDRNTHVRETLMHALSQTLTEIPTLCTSGPETALCRGVALKFFLLVPQRTSNSKCVPVEPPCSETDRDKKANTDVLTKNEKKPNWPFWRSRRGRVPTSTTCENEPLIHRQQARTSAKIEGVASASGPAWHHSRERSDTDANEHDVCCNDLSASRSRQCHRPHADTRSPGTTESRTQSTILQRPTTQAFFGRGIKLRHFGARERALKTLSKQR